MATSRKLSTRPPVTPNNAEKTLPVLITEWILFIILLLPYIALAMVRKILPQRGKSLDGKVVLVTGAAQGLARELALLFAKEGSKVACVDRDLRSVGVLETAAEIVRDGERAKAYVTNLASAEEIRVLKESVTKDLGPVDVLVNCADLAYVQRVDLTSEDAAKAVVSVNILGSFWMVKEFLPSMKDRDSGHIVTVSSASSQYHVSNAALFTSSRWALTGFMESLRYEVLDDGYRGIYFTTVMPGFMNGSRDYSFWQMLSSQQMEVVAVQTVQAVKRNVVSVTIPETLYWLATINKLLPTVVNDWLHDLLGFGKLSVSKEHLDRLEPAIIQATKSSI